MGRSYRDMVKNALDELEKDIGEVKNELNSIFTKIVKLAFLLGDDEYDSDLAYQLADEIKDLIDESITELDRIEESLY